MIWSVRYACLQTYHPGSCQATMVSSFGLVRPHQYIMTYTRLCRSEFLKPVKTDSLKATTITKSKTNKNWQISQLTAIKLLLITDHGASLLHKGFGIICLFVCFRGHQVAARQAADLLGIWQQRRFIMEMVHQCQS